MFKRIDRKALTLVVSCLTALSLIFAWVFSERAALNRLGALGSTVDSQLLPRLARWGEQRVPGVERIALFGDSVLRCGSGGDLGELLVKQLQGRGVASDVFEVGHPGFRATHFLYLLDRVLAAQPRFAVVEVNPRAFSDAFTIGISGDQNLLARELPIGWAIRLAPALQHEQVSLFDPLIYRGLDGMGMLNVPNGLRELGRSWLDEAGSEIESSLGLGKQSFRTPFRSLVELTGEGQTFRVRLSAEGARVNYGGQWALYPTTSVMSFLRETLETSGVPVLFYLTPVNVDRIAALGLQSELAIDEKAEALRLAIGATREQWLDLHGLVRDERFRDHSEHLTHEGCLQVARAIAGVLAARQPRASG